jgi:A/G-specific adenine glycosylase
MVMSELIMEQNQRLRSVGNILVAWYRANGRSLPWRENPEPYRVWISEIMLQQTRIEAVKPYFERFMTELPDIARLASVEDDRLMKLWEGLGYYSRARNLKKAAQILVKDYNSQMPSDYSQLIKLPGIGNYTAGAIASIAFGEPVPAVDGNVLRVMSRLLANREDILKQSVKRQMEKLLRETMPREAAGDFNQGIMELGETVCMPAGAPVCGACPVQKFCLAFLQNLTSELPVKSPPKKRRIEKRTVFILESGDEIGLHRRGDKGLLASLYELPNVEGYLKPEQIAGVLGLNQKEILALERLPESKHIFSHVEWHMTGYRVKISRNLPKDYIAAKKEELKTIYPLPNAFGRYTKLIK